LTVRAMVFFQCKLSTKDILRNIKICCFWQ
jgi:hypothetical protein